MKIYAHRGASSECPENTLGAFQRALALGTHGIELDVHLSSDGVPVVIHDATVERTTDGKGAVAELTLAELKELDAGQGERIPTLAEVLDLVGSAAHVDIEVKADEAADAAVHEARHRTHLRWAISSFDHNVLTHVRSSFSDIELWPLVVEVSDEALATALDLQSPVIAVYDQSLTREVVERITASTIATWVWTVNEPQRAKTLGEWSVEGICTDNPRLIMDAVQDS